MTMTCIYTLQTGPPQIYVSHDFETDKLTSTIYECECECECESQLITLCWYKCMKWQTKLTA